ncbi:MAG TPA: SpoIIE family protein phosphatase, partial [Solirubrobacteraceae bacterium]
IDVGLARVDVQPGETLLLYTDGLPDAGVAGRQLGEAGMIELCRQAPRGSLEEMLEHIERAAVAHAEGSLRDDLALLGVRVSHR